MKFGIILFNLLLLPLGICGYERNPLIIGTLLKPVLKDPSELNYIEDWELAQAVHETLFEYQDGEGLSPALAKKWEIDDSSINVEIFSGRRFSDGSFIQAEDVAFSIERTWRLDASKATVISQCANKGSQITFDNIANKIFLKNFTCPKRILRDMAEVNYAILKKQKKIVKNDFVAYSGLFIPDKIGEDYVLLKVNKYNLRFPKNGDANFKLKIQHIKKPLNKDLSNDVDFVRVDEDAKDTLFKYSKFSIPVAVWYLTLSKISTKASSKKLISSLRERWRNISINTDRTEEKVDFLFTNDFGCKYKPRPFNKKSFEDIKLTYAVESHPSEESKNIEKLLYKILDGAKIVKAEKSDLPDVIFKINRQFLSADANIVLETALKNSSKFSGDASSIKKRLDALQRNDEKVSVSALCKLSSELEIVPLISKKLLFLYKYENLQNIFLPSSGNIVFNRIFNDSGK